MYGRRYHSAPTYGRASFILGGLVLTFEIIPESIWIPTYGLSRDVENCAEACTSISMPSLLQIPKPVNESVSNSIDRREVDFVADACELLKPTHAILWRRNFPCCVWFSNSNIARCFV